jgi:hypothetical protein
MKCSVVKQNREIVFRSSMEHEGFASTIESYLLHIHHVHNKPNQVLPLSGTPYVESGSKDRLKPSKWYFEASSSILYVLLPKHDQQEIRILF